MLDRVASPTHEHEDGRSQPRFIHLGKPEAALAAGMLAVLVFLLLRNVGLYPSVFSDEYNYSQSSRLLKAADTSTPLYIYYYVYRLTRHAGTAFLEAARLLNVLFFVGAAPFIYLASRKVASKWVAVWIAILSLIGPINTYTAYFMPEAMYFFVFWWMSWFLLCRRDETPIYYGAAAGVLLSVLILVKVNAIFLLPGIVAFMIYANRNVRPTWFRVTVTQLSSFLVSVAVARLALGYLFAGKAGLQVLGTRYGSLAQSSATPARLSLLTSQIFGVLRGHVLGLSLLFAVAIASMLVILVRKDDDRQHDAELVTSAAYALLLLLPLLVAVAYFTASVVGESPYESLSRLHMRYYNFLFPLFLMVIAGQLTARKFPRNRYVVFLSVAALVCLVALSFRLLLRSYSPSLVDSPELHGVTMSAFSFHAVGILGIMALLIWAWNGRRGAQFALFAVMPATVLLSAVNGNSELRKFHLNATVEDRAGAFARDELDATERHRLAVVGSELAGLDHVLFYVDDPKATGIVIPSEVPFDPKTLPAGTDWVLLMGDHALPDDVHECIAKDDFILFRLPTNDSEDRPDTVRTTIDFSHPFRFGHIESIHGVSVPELFGRWSDGKLVRIEMSSPLPRQFDLHLIAKAFGPNSQLPFTVRIGEDVQTFRLSSSSSEVTLPFTTDGNTRTIVIEVPQPVSPKQLGEGNDERQLGIALIQMSIAREAAAHP